MTGNSLGVMKAAGYSASGAALRIDVITDEAGWRDLAGEWDALLAQMPRPSPFLRWNWLHTWWQHFGQGRALRIVTVRAAGALLGAAPLHVVKRRAAGLWPVRSLEFLGYRGSAVGADHLDLLAVEPYRPEVATALVSALLRRRDWDVFVFGDLAEDSPLPRAWQQAGAAVHLAARAGEICYFRSLPADTASLWREIKALHPKLASNVKYYRKRFEAQHRVRFIPEIAVTEAADVLAALAALHGSSRGRKGEAGNFALPAYAAFHQALVERLAASGDLYLARLECDGRIVAVLYGYVCGGVLYYYQSGFDNNLNAYGLGTLLVAWVMEDAVERLGAREFDFLRGAEDYKSRWAERARHTSYLYGWRKGIAGTLARGAWRLRARLAPARAGAVAWAQRLAASRAGSVPQ